MLTKQREKRHKRVRGKIFGTRERPRLNVFRSSKNIIAQIIDDSVGRTLVSASSYEKGFEGGGNVETSKKVGEMIGKRAIEKGIKKVVFDCGGFAYHGRVKNLADGARESGLEF